MHTHLSPHYTWDLAGEILDIIICQHFQQGLIFILKLEFLFSEGLTSEARFANTVIAVDAIFADAIITRVTGTIIKVYLAICACVDKDDLEFLN